MVDTYQSGTNKSHSMALITRRSKKLYVSGDGRHGQLGLGHTDKINQFTVVQELENVKDVSSGQYYKMCLLENGSVYGFGMNNQNQIRGDNTDNILSPIKVLDDVKQVACGTTHTMFLKKDGTVVARGHNLYGQLGLGHTTSPVVNDTIIPIGDVKSIHCGSFSTIFLKNDGTVWGCGHNPDGQLGLGHTNTPISSITKITISDVKQVACGASYTIFLKNDGTVWGCGNNQYGQLGLEHTNTPFVQIGKITISDVKQVACGSSYIIFLKNDGTVWGCGYNPDGQLGLGHTTTPISSISQCTIDGIAEVYSSTASTVFVKYNGDIYVCGYNSYGSLGLGNYDSKIVNVTKIPNFTLEETTSEITPKLMFYKTLEENVPQDKPSTDDEIHITEKGNMYTYTKDGKIVQLGGSGSSVASDIIVDTTTGLPNNVQSALEELDARSIIVNEESDIQDTPVGHIMSFMGLTPPSHYLACDGKIYNIADYPHMVVYLRKQFGIVNYFGGDGITTFAVPDMRGEFVRGYDAIGVRDPQGKTRGVGKHQDATEHKMLATSATSSKAQVRWRNDSWDSHAKQDSSTTIPNQPLNYGEISMTKMQNTSGSDLNIGYTSRPTNVNVLYCIKYEPTYQLRVEKTIEINNPLTTQPLEYSSIQVSSIPTVLNSPSFNRVPINTAKGTVVISNGSFVLKKGKLYNIELTSRIQTQPYGGSNIFIKNDSNGDAILYNVASNNGQSVSTYGVMQCQSTIYQVGDKDESFSLFTQMTTAQTLVEMSVVIYEIRNNPVNQYGGFESQILFDGNTNIAGEYLLADNVANYDFLMVKAHGIGATQNIINKMTSNNTPLPLIATASGNYGSDYAIWKAFNQTRTSIYDCWLVDATTGWIQIDTGKSTSCNGVFLSPRNDGTGIKNFTIQGSNDGTNWENILTNVADPLPLDGKSFKFNKTVNFRYYKLSGSKHGTYLAISQFDLTFSFEQIHKNSIIFGDKNNGVMKYSDTGFVDFKGNKMSILNLDNPIVKVIGYKGQLPSLLSGGEF